MAQVMVNFRIDEGIKRSMEQACREMGLSMTTAFTIFATKVGREKRIPFEITAAPCGAENSWKPPPPEEEPLAQTRERLEALCGEIRRSLTAVHTAIPASITGLPMERIRLLCGDKLKDQAAEVSGAVRSLFSARNAETLKDRDLSVLDEYLEGLASAAEEVRDIARTLIPTMKSWSGGDIAALEPYEQRLDAVSRALEALSPVMQRFLCSSAPRHGSAQAIQARLRQAAASIETPYVRTALDSLEAQVLRHYGALDSRTKTRLELHYLQTLELTLRELRQAEQDGGDPGAKAALCLRTVNVLSQVIAGGAQARRELSQRSLEAEVAALERLAAMRGDLTDGMRPEA
ncbi:type II toxin-antitoxin system RelB/DinJ family antitoxin [uncultured Oscillibacter sp.]|uniref:type II toxin-antitoxin system RelB/DinJ family antitoxin n=1 Tax=uncultured Oscillibacter sp. TaxID=876091 RepID=UPI00341B7E12